MPSIRYVPPVVWRNPLIPDWCIPRIEWADDTTPRTDRPVRFLPRILSEGVPTYLGGSGRGRLLHPSVVRSIPAPPVA